MLPEPPTLPNIEVSLLFKILVYLILAGFVFFAVFMWRQTVLASRVLQTKAAPIVKFLALVHFLVIVAISVVVILILR